MDKAALGQVKKVALVTYTVPPIIKVRKDPKEPVPPTSAQEVLAGSNGPRAATIGMKTFIKTLNDKGLSFKFMTPEEMDGNAAFVKVRQDVVRAQAEEEQRLKAEKEKEEAAKSTGQKVLGFLGSAFNKQPQTGPFPGVGPEGYPQFKMNTYDKGVLALTGDPREKQYAMDAAKALGVDAVMLITDPGYSWGCSTCIGDTGSASTASAFLATMVRPDGGAVLNMSQWFVLNPRSAVIVAGIINPLQYDSLFEGHGLKMAEVFASYYREEGGK
jgi:hypothetical protein